MSNQKKRRAENWTREERDILLEIIKNYRHILDNPNTDTNTNKLKNITWNHVNNRFHEVSNTSRDVPQLKSFWTRLKMAARKKARSQMNGITHSDNEYMSNCEDSSPHEATNISNYDNDDSLFGQVCNPSEVVLLVEPSTYSDSNSKSHILDEEINEEEVCSDSFRTDMSTLKYETSRDYDDALQQKLQNRENVKKKHKAGSLINNASKHNEKPEDNYAYKEFLLKRFYLRLYHKSKIKHENERHKLETDNLLLERKRIELEIELTKKKIESLPK